jgi:hypothetical protein
VVNTFSAFIPIPEQASDLIVLTREPSAAPALSAEFYPSQLALAEILYRVDNPTIARTPVVHGAQFVRFISAGVAQRITPMWELWL